MLHYRSISQFRFIRGGTQLVHSHEIPYSSRATFFLNAAMVQRLAHSPFKPLSKNPNKRLTRLIDDLPMGCNATLSAKDRLGAIWVQFAPILTPSLRFFRQRLRAIRLVLLANAIKKNRQNILHQTLGDFTKIVSQSAKTFFPLFKL